MKTFRIIILMAAVAMLAACRDEEWYYGASVTEIGEKSENISSMFLLNEGNMGSNKCTVDRYDYSTGTYIRNIFGEYNPDVVMELGDGGNDIGVYGGKLYIVVNQSNLVEVMDASTFRHITQISIPNGRNLAFCGGRVYVSSYAGAAYGDTEHRKGFVAEIDTLSMQVVGTCEVGYQPEEMVVYGSKLYVANSGGYCAPDYDRTVSVIDLTTFEVVKTIDVDVNLHRMELDAERGLIFVSSRGDYYEIPSSMYVIDTQTDNLIMHISDLPCADMALSGDSLYVYSTEFSYETYQTVMSYTVYDIARQTVVTRNFITDGTETQIMYPYGIAVNPENGDIFIADAKDFMTPGTLYCYGRDGRFKWSVMTGDLPGHFAFR